jgi:ComF family protein
LREFILGLLDLLLPPRCAGCGGPARAALCPPCGLRLPRIPRHHCTSCQRRPAIPPSSRCSACQRLRRPLDGCIAGCWFEGEAADWIRAFKYPDRSHALGTPDRARLHALVLETLDRAPRTRPDWLVPVPLHPRRLRGRGFNPAAVAARYAARALSLELRPTALQRVRDTPSQTGLRRRERRRNVRGAFRARGRVPERIWLVDDVVTTGATLEEAARALRRAGARQVVALCAARTPAVEDR